MNIVSLSLNMIKQTSNPQEDLKSVNWELESEGLDSVQTWNVTEKKVNAIIDTHVPKK